MTETSLTEKSRLTEENPIRNCRSTCVLLGASNLFWLFESRRAERAHYIQKIESARLIFRTN